MPNYRYVAKDLNGKKVRGTKEAISEDALYMRLREEGLYVLSYRVADQKTIGVTPKFSTGVLVNFCRELGTLLNAGVTLVRALKIIASEEDIKPQQQKVYNNLLEIIRQGVSLSDAMEQQGKAFPALLINMMRSAEANGNIGDTALRMSVHYEKEKKLQGKVVSAMIYPAILAGLLVVVVIFVLIYLVPQFADVFNSLETLPLPTRILMGFSSGVKEHWLAILITLGVLFVTWMLLLRIPKVRIAKDRMKIRMPVFGKLWRTIYTARFARTLSSLYSSGLPIVGALQIAAKTIGNSYIESQFPDMIAKVRAGDPLSSALHEVDGFVKKLASTIVIGEETGSLDSMLTSSADDLDYEADRALQRMVSLLEPAMIIIMAIIIGGVVVAVILPIYQSYSGIEQGGY